VTISQDTALQVAGEVPDPELPTLTVTDLGVLRSVSVDQAGGVTVTVTPTYSGCPALEVMRETIAERLRLAGAVSVEVRTVLAPAWSTDWITAEGRAKLEAAGIAPPLRTSVSEQGLTLHTLSCPRCRAGEPRLVNRFGATACRAQFACRACGEPFDHMKDL
jgi:ring-1,2-phenylacetyl-CoA epoxidase subunit PaaD